MKREKEVEVEEVEVFSGLNLHVFLLSVFSFLPKLQVLDGIPKLPEDSMTPRLQLPENTRMCNIL